MNSGFFMLPVAVPQAVAATLTQLSANQYSLLSQVEADCLDHWIFNNGAASLTGLKAASTLTAQGTAPTYGSNFLTLAAGQNGLASAFADTPEHSYCAVVQMPTLGSGIGVMAAGTVSSADSNGDGIYLQNSSGVSLTLNGRAMPNAVQAAATPVAGNWAFVAGSIKSGVGTTAYVGGVGGTDVASANAKAVASRNIVLGTTLGYTSGSFQSIALPVAEFIIFGTRKLAADWPAIYARSKTRMSNAGLILS